MIYGTPQAAGAEPEADRGQDPGDLARLRHLGRGRTASAIPYLFPLAATYWSQGAAAIQFVKDKLGGSLKGKKIAYRLLRQPGRHASRCRSSKDLQKSEGFELRTFAVPPPGVEMGAQVLDISQRYRPDFVIDAPVRPLAVGGDQGTKARRAFRCPRCWASSGPRPRPTSRRPAAGRSPRATTRCSSPASATTTRCCRKSRRCTRRQGKAAAEGDGDTVVLQPRHPGRRGACRGDAQRAQGERRQAADRRATSRRASR